MEHDPKSAETKDPPKHFIQTPTADIKTADCYSKPAYKGLLGGSAQGKCEVGGDPQKVAIPRSIGPDEAVHPDDGLLSLTALPLSVIKTCDPFDDHWTEAPPGAIAQRGAGKKDGDRIVPEAMPRGAQTEPADAGGHAALAQNGCMGQGDGGGWQPHLGGPWPPYEVMPPLMHPMSMYPWPWMDPGTYKMLYDQAHSYPGWWGGGADVDQMGDDGEGDGEKPGASKRNTQQRRERRRKAQQYAAMTPGGCGDAALRQPGVSPGAGRGPNWRDESCETEKEQAERRALTAQIEGGDAEQQRLALEKVKGNVEKLSFGKEGCRVVQAALKHFETKEAKALSQELKDKVKEAINSPHANYVLQQIIAFTPPKDCTFVAEALMEFNPQQAARHRFGCRILCRLVEAGANTEETGKVINALLENVDGLARHSFAHHVISQILDQGTEAQKTKVKEQLKKDLVGYAKNRNASYVLEKAMEKCDKAERDGMAGALVSSPEQIRELSGNQFGSYVMKSLAEQPGEARRKIESAMRSVTAPNKFEQRVKDALQTN